MFSFNYKFAYLIYCLSIVVFSTGCLDSKNVNPHSTQLGATENSNVTKDFGVLDLQLKINPVVIVAGKNSAIQLDAIYLDDSTQNITNLSIFQVSDGSVATIIKNENNDTLIQTHRQGTVSLTASFANIEKTIDIIVLPEELNELNIQLPTQTFYSGNRIQTKCLGIYTNGIVIDHSLDCIWSSSNSSRLSVDKNTSIISLDLLEAGDADINASFQGKSTSTTLTINPPSFEFLTTEDPIKTIALGSSAQLSMSAHFSDLSVENVTDITEYQTVNGIVSVNSEGLIETTTLGSDTIKATYNGKTIEIQVNVIQPTIKNIAISPTSLTIANGLSSQLTLITTLTDNSQQDMTSAASWSSLNTGVASVSSSGLVFANNSGTTSIQANLNGFTESINIIVDPIQPVSLEIRSTVSPFEAVDSISKPAGLTETFTVWAKMTNNSFQNITESFGSGLNITVSPSTMAKISKPTVDEITLTAEQAQTGMMNLLYKGVSLTFPLAVSNSTLNSISIQAVDNDTNIDLGKIETFQVFGTFSDEAVNPGPHLLASNQAFWFINSFSGIEPPAYVDNSTDHGDVQSLREGSFILNANVSGIQGSLSINVGPAVFDDIILTDISGGPFDPEFIFEETRTFEAQVQRTDGSIVDFHTTCADYTPSFTFDYSGTNSFNRFGNIFGIVSNTLCIDSRIVIEGTELGTGSFTPSLTSNTNPLNIVNAQTPLNFHVKANCPSPGVLFGEIGQTSNGICWFMDQTFAGDQSCADICGAQSLSDHAATRFFVGSDRIDSSQCLALLNLPSIQSGLDAGLTIGDMSSYDANASQINDQGIGCSFVQALGGDLVPRTFTSDSSGSALPTSSNAKDINHYRVCSCL